jgi:hypothetical protein
LPIFPLFDILRQRGAAVGTKGDHSPPSARERERSAPRPGQLMQRSRKPYFFVAAGC